MNFLNVLQKFAKLFHSEWWSRNIEELKQFDCYNHPLYKYDISFYPWINHGEINITIRLHYPIKTKGENNDRV